MLVAWTTRIVGAWARNTGAISFFFVLIDALGVGWTHDAPGQRLALILGIGLVGAVLEGTSRVRG